MIGKLWHDFLGLRRVCGDVVALRWLASVAICFPQCVRGRSLNAADRFLGEGPFRARSQGSTAMLHGYQVISHVREIWVRDVYGIGQLPESGTVLDLGANRGFFTAAAAGRGPSVRVIAVEASRVGCRAISDLAERNGWSARIEVCNAFIGGDTHHQHDEQSIPDHKGVGYLTLAQLLDRYKVQHVDFLKCDIEGSEFGLIESDPEALDHVDSLAMEVHYDVGSRQRMTRMLESAGFVVTIQSEAPDGCILRARKQGVAQPKPEAAA
jgi:FkbM family methyltransferase